MNNNSSDVYASFNEFIDKIKKYIENNTMFIAFFITAFVIVLLTYFYSEKYRTKSKVDTVLNTLSYTKPRQMIDFCGLDNNTNDKMFVSVDINEKEMSKFMDLFFKARDMGLNEVL